MTIGRISKGLAALSVAAVAMLGAPGAALAQEGPYSGPGRSASAPGQGNFASCPNDANRTGNPGRCGRGAQMSASSGRGSLDPGTSGEFGVESTYQRLGSFTVNADGAAVVSFTVPNNLSNGRHDVVFLGTKNGQPVEVRVPFTVSGTAGAAGAGGRSGQLPRTGADQLVPLALSGAALVALGAGVVVVARRRREDIGQLPA